MKHRAIRDRVAGRDRLGRCVVLAVSCLACGGCMQRLITITSEPAGALVHLNDEEVGRTPLTVPFTFYGTYDVRLEADGHDPLWTKQKAVAPWWETPPLDLAAEALGAKSHLKWHFPMAAEGPRDEPALLGRAEELRGMVAGGSAEIRNPNIEIRDKSE